jgi:hypothetical protein
MIMFKNEKKRICVFKHMKIIESFFVKIKK